MRLVIVGVWRGYVVIVLGVFSIWELCVFGEIMWWYVWWLGLVGVGGVILACIA